MSTELREMVQANEAGLPARRLPARDLAAAADGAGHRLTRRSQAAEVVLAYLAAQVARLRSLDSEVRGETPDSVHQMRVAARRLRSTFQAFPTVLAEPATARLREDLKWLGQALGEARDAEVLAGYLGAGLAGTPPELVLGPAQARIRAHFAPREASAREVVREALQSGRYFTLLDELDRVVDDPPLAAEAADPAGEVLPRAIARAYRRTRRRVRRAERAPAGEARDAALHETRKAAKRARYAAEAAQPVFGKKASRFAKRMKAVQSILGDHHDAVTARAATREIGVHAHLVGENAFTFGLLHERAHRDAREFEEQAMSAWERAARRKSRGWLGTSS